MKFAGKNRKKFAPKHGGKRKSPNFNNKAAVKTRRELRKEERQRKKVDKVNSYLNRMKKFHENRKGNKNKNEVNSDKAKGECTSDSKSNDKSLGAKSEKPRNEIPLTDLFKENLQSKRDQKLLEGKMKKQRLQALKDANKDEDRLISNLEKQLRLNKRKSKSLPASFTSSGLDYILDVCNPEKMKNLAESEKYLQDSGSEFEDDLATIKGQDPLKRKGKKLSKQKDSNLSGDEDLSDSEANSSDNETELFNEGNGSDEEFSDDDSLLDDLEGDDSDDSTFSSDEITKRNTTLNSKPFTATTNKLGKRKVSELEMSDKGDAPAAKSDIRKKKKLELNVPELNEESDNESKGRFVLLKPKDKKKSKGKRKSDMSSEDDTLSDKDGEDLDNSKPHDEVSDETWEDIYGRTRDKQGNVIEANKGKYIPPALRGKALGEDAKKREIQDRLRRQLKGLLNRLAESNMHSIVTQTEELYMKNSRNDMNESLISLYTEAIVSPVHTPERLIMEHAMLTAILHANIGTEVGAYILQTFVTNFDKLLSEGSEISDKRLDNLLAFICHLYTFKVFDNSLLYNILGVLCDKFGGKEIDLILVVLRNSGFTLRKDDPVALKELVLRIQRLANQASELKNDSRVNFMLDVLLKIKNNNMSKLPQYDPSHSEHLKKVIKTMIRKGNYVTELKISLQDLLQAEERGRWWIVGSAWTGPSGTEQVIDEENAEHSHLPTMSDQLTQLAKKLRINTDIRKNIFCILMTAEDFEDAFEKLHRLGLKGQTMNEIMHVLLHCLLQEKEYNHYYALIANRFAQTDRKYRMVVQYSLWDKFKEVENMKQFQVTNLAKFLAFLFIEGTLPLSVLKVIQLVEMTKGNVRLIRQVLLSVLYHKDEVTSGSVFLRLNKSTKLHLFREGLRLFLHHFLLKNMKQTDQDYEFLKKRITMADMALQSQTY